jgi:murein DD-endopeptidase
MRRGVSFLVLAVLAVTVGAASALAAGTTTATATTTTGATTTTSTTTATVAAPYAPLPSSLLPAGCVGAGAAAIAPPSHSVVALGTPASNLGPSGYPQSASVVAFSSSSASGSTCGSEHVTLASVSLFGGAVTAASVEATDGSGTVVGLEIDGTAASITAGQTTAVEGWGRLTLGGTVGRLRAPLVIRLLQPHNGLLAGTAIAVAFAATAQPVAKTKEKHHSSQGAHPNQTTRARSHRHTKRASAKRKHRRRQPQKPPPDFPRTSDPLLAGGGLATAARDNPVVSAAMRYLGVPYLWGGASPKTGFDCSGLVKYVFAQLGVSLPHYAAAQYYSPDGVWLAPNQLRAGDLVFFTGSDGTHKEPGHVGIYIGDGYLIDAPHTGSFVRVDSLDGRWFANKYVGARRIVSPLHAVRHLLDASQPVASASAIRLDFPSSITRGAPVTVGAFGDPFGSTAASTTGSPSRTYWIWIGVVLGGLLLPLSAAGLLIRRRHTREGRPSSEASH